MATVNTPYRDLLPPLSTDEKAALKADIKANGVRDMVILDEDGNVLDGHHRLECDPKAPTTIIRGLSEGEKQSFVFRSNFNRRNLSPSQKTDLRKRMKVTAKILREEDDKKWTQKRVAEVLGVGQQTVSDWFAKKNGSNTGAGNTSKPKPDARVKVPPQRKPEIAERINAGESREQVAADFGISGRQAASIANRSMNFPKSVEICRPINIRSGERIDRSSHKQSSSRDSESIGTALIRWRFFPSFQIPTSMGISVFSLMQ